MQVFPFLHFVLCCVLGALLSEALMKNFDKKLQRTRPAEKFLG